jgi:plastocyanin
VAGNCIAGISFPFADRTASRRLRSNLLHTKERFMQGASFRITRFSFRALAPLALVVCASLAVPALRAAAATPAGTVELDIAKFAYAPKEITVAPGTKVVWTNRDGAPHTVTSADKSFASTGLDTGDAFEHTFATEGDFNYICTVHPFMNGVVHVRKQ